MLRPPFELFEPFFSSRGGRFVACRNAWRRQRLQAAPHPIARKTLPPQPFAAQSPSIIAQHARLSAEAPSFAAPKTEPDTQAHAKAAGTLCCGCGCSCGDVGLQCCSSARGSAGRGVLLVGNLEHCSSQRSSILSCSHVAAECRSRVLRWWLQYVLPCLFSYLCELCCAGWGMGWLSGRGLVC